ncbi:hypothetical protein AVEN_122137-1 [Araneus ventricosus]|uniref:Uncharacterized protein n=1 Tax=Araneus ventricosus TaxID=182803 RepID=A0A4Y2I9M9_ARAVE|nr:hypothetical protein AVEN_122137-1 [Araneus ventricosus]
MVLQRRGWQTHVSAGTKITGTHSERFMFIPVRPRPPWSPTREGSYRLWNFPASALTLGVAPGYRPAGLTLQQYFPVPKGTYHKPIDKSGLTPAARLTEQRGPKGTQRNPRIPFCP